MTGPVRSLWGLAGASRWQIARGLACVVAARTSALILPSSSGWILDEVIVPGRPERLVRIGALCAVALVVHAAASFEANRQLANASMRVAATLRRQLFRRLLGATVTSIERQQVGTLVRHSSQDPEAVAALCGTGLSIVGGALCTAVVGAGVLFHINLTLGLLACAIVGVGQGAFFLAVRRTWPVHGRASTRAGILSGRLTEVMRAIYTVKVYGRARREEGRLVALNHEAVRAASHASVTAQAVASASALMLGAVSTVVLLRGASLVSQGEMSPGQLMAFVALLGTISAPFAQVMFSLETIGQGVAAWKRCLEVLSMPQETERGLTPGCVGRAPIGRLALEGVAFGYPGGRDVIHRASFAVNETGVTAVLGKSGSGKSTLVKLLAGLVTPSEGRITIGGVDIREFTLADYRRTIAVVLQETVLFEGTLADNIAYGNVKASEADIRMAGRMTNCDEFADELPEGYRSKVGEAGAGLSGGQRQRIAIARALLSPAAVVILDEPTSQLDAENAAAVWAGIHALAERRAVLLFAHRLPDGVSPARVIHLENGHVSLWEPEPDRSLEVTR